MLDNNKISATIQAIQNQRGLTNEEFGRLIGVSGSFVSQIKNGKREMGKKTFERFIEEFGVDSTTLQINPEDKPTHIAESITELLKIRKIELDDLSNMTGIRVMELSQIQRGVLKPTDEHIKKLSKALNIKPEILEQGRIFRAFETIRREMESINISKDAIKAFLKDLEREI